MKVSALSLSLGWGGYERKSEIILLMKHSRGERSLKKKKEKASEPGRVP